MNIVNLMMTGKLSASTHTFRSSPNTINTQSGRRHHLGSVGGPDYGLFVGRLVPEFIDTQLPRLWLESCYSQYHDTCGRSVSGISSYFRFLVVSTAV